MRMDDYAAINRMISAGLAVAMIPESSLSTDPDIDDHPDAPERLPSRRASRVPGLATNRGRRPAVIRSSPLTIPPSPRWSPLRPYGSRAQYR
jgi:hypothetical protein